MQRFDTLVHLYVKEPLQITTNRGSATTNQHNCKHL